LELSFVVSAAGTHGADVEVALAVAGSATGALVCDSGDAFELVAALDKARDKVNAEQSDKAKAESEV